VIRRIILITICIINIFIFSYSADINMLIGSKLTYSFMIGHCEISLNNDSTYKANYESEGLYWHNEGNYSIKGDKILLSPNDCSPNENSKDIVPCKLTLGRAEFRIIDDHNSLYYSKFAECTSLDNNDVLGLNSSKILFPLMQYKVKSGEERVFNGVNVIVLTGATGITTSNVKIRKSPSINSEALKYTDKIYLDPASKTYDFVPANTKIYIIARTKNKYSVDKWNNYWYLISVGMNEEVWMYGEFIKIK
jgi:hypothetical protein